MKSSLAVVGSLLLGSLLGAPPARAQQRSFVTADAGFYWWFDAGAAIAEAGHVTEFGGTSSDQAVEYSVGGSLDFAAGYAFNKYVAAELQIGGTWNSIDSVEGASVEDSYFGTAPILANVVLQCPIPRTVIVPYLGAGVGGAATMFDTDGYYQRLPGGAVTLYGSSSDFVFAWQGFAGVRFDLNDTMSLGVAYRYLQVDPSTFDYESWYSGEPDLHLGWSRYESHTVVVTFLMRF